jgi:hypothetical protein
VAGERGRARVLVGRVVLKTELELFEETGPALRAALRGSGLREINRYGRVWRLGRVNDVDLDGIPLLVGVFGFEGADAETAVWDEAARDWRHSTYPRGETVSFAIRLDNLQIAFQVRPGVIDPGPFVSAFVALLDEESPSGRRWDIQTGLANQPYGEWRKTVRRVTRAKAQLVLPNPNFRGRPKIERMFTDFQLDHTRVDMTFRADAETSAVDEVVDQLVDHAERGYGSAEVVGERSDTHETTTFRTDGSDDVVEVEAEDDGVATSSGLVSVLAPEEVTRDEQSEQPEGG